MKQVMLWMVLCLAGCQAEAPRVAAQQVVMPTEASGAPLQVPTDAKVVLSQLALGAPSKGDASAPVTVVVFSDFECPFCARGAQIMSELEKAYGSQVKWVFRHNPLPMHANAHLAAQASVFAQGQGKFWQFHDRLFSQKPLDRSGLLQAAKAVGLDFAGLEKALDSGQYKTAVDADLARGRALGVEGTPTFFINGRKVVGAQPFAQWKGIIDAEKRRAEDLLKTGTPVERLYEVAALSAPVENADPRKTDDIPHVDVGQAPVRGSAKAPVTLVVFSDFECPFCARVAPTIAALEKKYGQKIRVAFKHQPLAFHAHAKDAAIASLAAHQQGKFWAFHDRLFTAPSSLDMAGLEAQAQAVGLNLQRFRKDIASEMLKQAVSADMAQAESLGVNGTPTVFVNGRALVGALPLEAFERAIDVALAAARP